MRDIGSQGLWEARICSGRDRQKKIILKKSLKNKTAHK